MIFLDAPAHYVKPISHYNLTTFVEQVMHSTGIPQLRLTSRAVAILYSKCLLIFELGAKILLLTAGGGLAGSPRSQSSVTT